jgi:hypothetical protein
MIIRIYHQELQTLHINVGSAISTISTRKKRVATVILRHACPNNDRKKNQGTLTEREGSVQLTVLY